VKQPKDFYPDYLVEILLVIFMTIELVSVLALLCPQDIGRRIDFFAPFSPRPEWYFLWLYQLIRYFPGGSIVIGTTVIPLLAVLVFMLVPFIDQGRRGRLKALIAGATLLFLFVLLTILAFLNP